MTMPHDMTYDGRKLLMTSPTGQQMIPTNAIVKEKPYETDFKADSDIPKLRVIDDQRSYFLFIDTYVITYNF